MKTVLNIDSTKRYLIARRKRIAELWGWGYTVDEIARYFEVRTESVDQSLVKCGINQFDRQIGCNAKRRDFKWVMSHRDGLEESGFYKKPEFYDIAKGDVIFEELLCGFKNTRISQVLPCPTTDVLRVSSDSDNSAILQKSKADREVVANVLLGSADNWSLDEVSEFTGLSRSRVMQLENAPKHKRKSANNMETFAYKKKNLVLQVADSFLSGKTQQVVADEFGYSRTTISKCLKAVCELDPERGELIKEKLKRHGADIVTARLRFHENYSGSDQILKLLKERYVQEGLLTQTQKVIARELGVSEQIVQKLAKENGLKPYKERNKK